MTREGLDMRMRMAMLLSKPLGLFAPGLALRYLHHQARLSAAYGYAAARRDGPNGRWKPRDGRADDMILRDASLIRARARAMARDNANLGGALRKLAANIVFTGIWPQAQLRKANGEPRAGANKALEADWREWAALNDLWVLQQLAVRHLWLDGGFFLHFFPDRQLLRDGLPPLGVELLDMDALDEGYNEDRPGLTVRHGMELDSSGRVTAYYLWRNSLYGGRDETPTARDGATRPVSGLGERVRLPLDACRLVMLPERIGQTLPVSWLHGCIMLMRDFDEYQNSERVAARLAAAFAVFLKQSDTAMGGMGNNLDGSQRAAALTGGATTDGRPLNIDHFISQGRIDVLPPGTDIAIAENKRPGTNYESYTRASLRGASTGLGMSYESFSNDFSDASYSSARQAVLEERRGYKMQQAFLAEKMLEPLWRVFVTWRRLYGLGSEKRVPVVWQYPGWSWVDPAKDAAAARTRLELGLTSRRILCAEQGLDFDDVVEALAQEQALMERKGLAAAPAGPGGQSPAPDNGKPGGSEPGGSKPGDSEPKDSKPEKDKEKQDDDGGQ